MEKNTLAGPISSEDNYFCYLYVWNHQITYLSYVQLALGLILLFFTYRHYRNLNKNYRNPSKHEIDLLLVYLYRYYSAITGEFFSYLGWRELSFSSKNQLSQRLSTAKKRKVEHQVSSNWKQYVVKLLEIFIAILLLAISIYAISKKNRITEIVEKQQIKRLRNQYFILLMCCLIKSVVGIYVVLTNNQKDFNVKCILDPQLSTGQIVFGITIYSLLFVFNYYLPTCFILRIFDLRPDYEVSQSLLITGSGSEDIIRS